MVLYISGHCEHENVMGKCPQNNMTIAMLHSVLLEAAYEGRLIKGLHNCTQILHSNPDELMVCVLPESSSDVTLGIKTILIESICLEYGIPVVRVDAKQIKPLRCHSLETEFEDFKSDLQYDESSPILQLDCFLIQKRAGDADDNVMKMMSLLQAAEDDGYK